MPTATVEPSGLIATLSNHFRPAPSRRHSSLPDFASCATTLFHRAATITSPATGMDSWDEWNWLSTLNERTTLPVLTSQKLTAPEPIETSVSPFGVNANAAAPSCLQRTVPS